jgi:hypothetical protein
MYSGWMKFVTGDTGTVRQNFNPSMIWEKDVVHCCQQIHREFVPTIMLTNKFHQMPTPIVFDVLDMGRVFSGGQHFNAHYYKPILVSLRKFVFLAESETMGESNDVLSLQPILWSLSTFFSIKFKTQTINYYIEEL